MVMVLLLMWGVPIRPWSERMQTQVHAQSKPRHRPADDKDAPDDETITKLKTEMAKKANAERQANLKRDTDKLVELATELKQYVDKTNENMLSLEVIHKAGEIEKLAHSVKEKMKGD